MYGMCRAKSAFYGDASKKFRGIVREVPIYYYYLIIIFIKITFKGIDIVPIIISSSVLLYRVVYYKDVLFLFSI